MKLTPRHGWLATAALLMFFSSCSLVFGFANLTDEDVSAWLEAVGTVLAVGVTSAAAYFAAQAAQHAKAAVQQTAGVLAIEEGRERDRVEAAKRSQAALVAAWPGHTMVERTRPNGDMRTYPRYGVWIRNASNLPVTQVAIHAELNGVALEEIVVPLVPPGSEPLFVRHAGESYDDVEGAWRAFEADPLNVTVEPVVTLQLTFTDSGGQTWTRLHHGQLR